MDYRMGTLIVILVICLVITVIGSIIEHYQGDKDSIHDDYMY
jgi:hypothetical protein